MDVAISMDQEELLPLLHKKSQNDTEPSSIQQESKLDKVHNGQAASMIVLGLVWLESIAYYGIAANLVGYLGTVLHGSNASNAANVAIWAGTSFLMPVFGAFLADSYFGNYKMILISLLTLLLGLIMMTTSAFKTTLKPSQCEASSCSSDTRAQKILFFSALYLVSIGSGGVKATLLPFGADQFDDQNEEDRERKNNFFSFYYITLVFGALISCTLIVWLQENVGWALGYGVLTLCVAIALVGFLLGTPLYSLGNPHGSPLKSVLQVLVASFSNRSLTVPTDTSLLYEVNDKTENNTGKQRLAHTDGCRFLDKAAIPSGLRNHKNSGKECTVTQVEELKILVRLMPIWAAGLIYSAAFRQPGTTFIQQGYAMNTKIMSFSIPPATLSSFETISVMVWIMVLNRLIMPVARKWLGNEVGLTQLQRMGIGQFLMIVAMTTAAYLEMQRLDNAKHGETLTIAWQLPQYFIVAGSESIYFVALIEFFYSQAPETMKCMCTSFSQLTISFGSYLSSLLVALVAFATTSQGRPGWIPDDLNKGHLDYFFLGLAGLCALNFICFIVCSRNYTPKKVIVET